MKSKAGQPPPRPVIPEATMGNPRPDTSAVARTPGELSDLIYDQPHQSQGVVASESGLENWITAVVGGIEIFLKPGARAHLKELKAAMLAAHPARGGSESQFIEAYKRYNEAKLTADNPELS